MFFRFRFSCNSFSLIRFILLRCPVCSVLFWEQHSETRKTRNCEDENAKKRNTFKSIIIESSSSRFRIFVIILSCCLDRTFAFSHFRLRVFEITEEKQDGLNGTPYFMDRRTLFPSSYLNSWFQIKEILSNFAVLHNKINTRICSHWLCLFLYIQKNVQFDQF